MYFGCVILEPLLPTLRKRKRYIAIEVLSCEDIRRDIFIKNVFASACSVIGDAGVAGSGLSVFGFENNKGIVRCYHNSVEKIICSLSLITNIGGKRVIVCVKGVGGTVKSTRSKFHKDLFQ